MSNNLDKRLGEALDNNFEAYPAAHLDFESAIKEIKEAFTLDGWLKTPQVEVVTRWEAGGKPEVIMINGEDVKKKANTITVDLDVFESEIKAQEFAIDEAEWKSLIKALKKAAGIS